MYTVYRIDANSLDKRFIDAVKAMFRDKEIEIAVCEVTDNEEDETAYLLKSPANRKRLLDSIENINKNQNIVTVNMDQLE
ncbi:Uncharacterized protein dnl_56670 [Desulfonema limicola]|uniref:Antitoxin n=1 Tax=Desulfonema limicola TaxID=45656 RepID=A0A975BDB7_9BACT|nr:hypothetical protein [Desulfonema limicola]QTA83271.1 Uncharacterized protein dnl_56670 [Desulfonema limicola]